MEKDTFRIARKELASLFASPTALIFIGAFLSVTLFTFFWVETFFSRNIADVRPLFEWMPVLLIFLMGAVTMRMWSEERRMGTLEYLMTMPVKTARLVLGKFLACWALALTALALTIFIPLTVSFMGPLDWGPVIGGYVAAAFLAAAYAAVGLYVSSKTDSQIVSLLVSTLAGAVLYVVGSDLLTGFVGNTGSEVLKLFGTGARFESITRGVLDIRDIYYYLSLTAVFLALNVYSLETLRWSRETAHPRHRTVLFGVILLCANFLAANLWLRPVGSLRVDMTQGKSYSISPATKNVLAQLREPLLIRGYFSQKTHPLLAPLVPQLRDTIVEYQTASRGRIRSEFIDPMEKPELEKEAGEKYGIKAVPFQVADKYQAGLVNSYFNILVSYGDKFEVLGFDSLIEVKQGGEAQLDVQLRNPEYDITRAIKKVLQSYQSEADLFATIQKPVSLVGYISSDKNLPPALLEFRAQLDALLNEIKTSAGDKFTFDYKDPQEGDGSLARELAKKYGVQPLRVSLFDPTSFYFHLMMQSGNKAILIPIPQDLTALALRQAIESGLKRFSVGFLRTIALTTAPPEPHYTQETGFKMEPDKHFDMLKGRLTENHTVNTVDLKNGVVPEESDLLFMASPKDVDEKQLFAMDQFLMKGGTVVLLVSPFQIKPSPLGAAVQNTGLKDWLEHKGIDLKQEFVMDAQNIPFPIPVERRMGQFVFQEMKMINYPYFIDVRGPGFVAPTLTAGLPQVTLHWASPVRVDADKNKGRTVTVLLNSSDQSWTSNSTQITPAVDRGGSGFVPSGPLGPSPLAVSVEGEFESFFKDKKSPLLPEKKDPKDKDAKDVFSNVIEKSALSARLIVVGSADFLSDELLRFTSSVSRTNYTNSLQLAENIVDWSLEDRGLLAIRGRGHFARLLKPMTNGARMFWEYLNYGLILSGVVGVWAGLRVRRRRRLAAVAALLTETKAGGVL
jgi:ABC-2 type transport system permease protein